MNIRVSKQGQRAAELAEKIGEALKTFAAANGRCWRGQECIYALALYLILLLDSSPAALPSPLLRAKMALEESIGCLEMAYRAMNDEEN